MKIIWLIYLAALFNSAIHETGHIIAAKLVLKIPVYAVRIGSELLSFSVGKVSFSPLPAGGAVEVAAADVIKNSRYQILLFFEAGSIMNAVFAIAFLLLAPNRIKYIFFFVGMSFLVESNIPFGKTDLASCRRLLNDKAGSKK